LPGVYGSDEGGAVYRGDEGGVGAPRRAGGRSYPAVRSSPAQAIPS